MSELDDQVASELSGILERVSELMILTQFDDDEKMPSQQSIQRLRLMGKNAEADELGELLARAAELEAEHRTKQ